MAVALEQGALPGSILHGAYTPTNAQVEPEIMGLMHKTSGEIPWLL